MTRSVVELGNSRQGKARQGMRRDVMEMEKEMEKNAFCDACLLFSDTCEQPLLQTLYTLPLREWYTRVVIDSRARRRQQHTHTHTHTHT